jgi:purine catabolism regulator
VISLDALVAERSLGLCYLAGADGGDRLVTWAHGCDVPEPWTWCRPGDLVMTRGGGLPATPAGRRRWLDRLAGSGAAGVLISPRPGSPEITDTLRAAAAANASASASASAKAFPVLAGAPDLDFGAVARAVIDGAVRTERKHIAATRRLYTAYRQALRTHISLRDRLAVLEHAVGWRLEIVDQQTGRSARPDAAHENGDMADVVAGDVARDVDGVVPIPARRPALLIAHPDRDRVVDTDLLHDLGGLVGLELEHQAGRADQLRASGAAILGALLDGRLDIASVRLDLHNRGLDDPLVVVCWASSNDLPLAHEDLHHHTALEALVPLLLHRSGDLFALLPSDDALIGMLGEELGRSCVAGVSAVISHGNGVIEAARQARLSAGLAIEAGVRSRRYGSATGMTGLLPQSVEDARKLVRRVLGALVDYDAAHSSELTATLFTFLENDRTLRRTAAELNIHRQTLVYRLRRTEEILGFKPSTTAGISMLWQAFNAARHAGIDVAGSPQRTSSRREPPR